MQVNLNTYNILILTIVINILIESAKDILSGNFRSEWTDVNTSRFFYTKRIIKDIRTNLMLGWIKQIKPNLPIIIAIRNPYSVIDSYKTLGWGKEAGGQITDFERIISQKYLLKDFPIINEILQSINQNDYVSKLIFQWCALYYVPLKQLDNKDYLLVQYENLLLHPKSELDKIFNYLNKPFNTVKILDRIEKPSVTNYRKTDFNSNKVQLIQKWNQSLITKEINTINEIINNFEINFLYDKNGHPKKLNKDNLWKT